MLLLLIQIAYVPNAIVWSICYTLGPGFAFGIGTVVAPTGSALGSLPLLPMLAALPTGAHSAVPAWASAVMLSVPYLAGAFGGLLTARAAPTPALELAPLWGFGCGVATAAATGLLAAFAGGPLGSGRLAAVGPSGWQTAVVAALEVGVAAAVTAGLANWLRMRRVPRRGAPGPAGGPRWPGGPAGGRPGRPAPHLPGPVGRRGRRAARPRRATWSGRAALSWPAGLRGDLLDRVDELVLAGLLGGDRVGPAQAPGERARLLAEQREGEQQDAAEQHPDRRR